MSDEHRQGPIPPDSPSRRSLLRIAGIAGAAGLVGIAGAAGTVALMLGYAAPQRGPGVPLQRTRQASVLGLPNERFFPFYGLDRLEAECRAAVDRQRRALAPGAPLPPVQLLAMSGGGESGAFGAGLLCGWSEYGTRPVFELVTGVSTGALAAPLAFLGRAYDPQLRAMFNELKASDVMASRGYSAALFDDALNDNQPLFRTISRVVDEAMLTALAKAYGEGRLLFIGTTDLDAQQPVIWNIGAIAASGHPRALDTIRRLLLASAAIPGVFPPTMIDVTLDGKRYQEMHVDGGAFMQVFLYPDGMSAERQERMQNGEAVVPAIAYVIRNAWLGPDWSVVERSTLGITQRAVSTLIASSGYNDILRLFGITQQDNIDFRLAYIGADFDREMTEPFDHRWMQALFDYGYQRARNGYAWAARPPV